MSRFVLFIFIFFFLKLKKNEGMEEEKVKLLLYEDYLQFYKYYKSLPLFRCLYFDSLLKIFDDKGKCSRACEDFEMSNRTGLLRIRLLRGINLAIRDAPTRSSDPYVVISTANQVPSSTSDSSSPISLPPSRYRIFVCSSVKRSGFGFGFLFFPTF